jgi:hypothetical protein
LNHFFVSGSEVGSDGIRFDARAVSVSVWRHTTIYTIYKEQHAEEPNSRRMRMKKTIESTRSSYHQTQKFLKSAYGYLDIPGNFGECFDCEAKILLLKDELDVGDALVESSTCPKNDCRNHLTNICPADKGSIEKSI